ncbi:MAG: penicillin-binding transpeptidase domain-containing protein [Erysipelotrichaceae bacterium]
MNTKRANRTMTYLILVIVIIGTLVAANVLFTMATGVHLRSGINIKDALSNTKADVLVAKRGTIKDRNGNVIASDLDSYTLIAYMSKTRTDGNKEAYVKDTQKTADLLSPILMSDPSVIKKMLDEAKSKGLYQTALGVYGSNLTINEKEKIDALELPGLGFEKSSQRYYTDGKFASQLIGYARYNDELGRIEGEMGLEKFLDKQLKGSDGSVRYKKDVNGNVFGSKFVEKQAVNGGEVTLTLDKNVQLALESALDKTMTQFNSTRAWGIVSEVETGKILAWSGYPSFDLNDKDIEDWRNVPSEYAYEPGSTMKAFTYGAAMDSGVYDGNQTFESGTFNWFYDTQKGITRTPTQTSDDYLPINDALGKSWGNISYDKGFVVSANTGICDLIANHLNPKVFERYLDKFGFFKPVNVYGINEVNGKKNFTYPVDQLSAGFGQGSSVTALQMVQAYSAIFNDGKMMKPYYIDRISNGSDTNKTIYQGKKEVVGNPISAKVAKQLQDLMDQVVNSDGGSGRRYHMDDVRLIAKTGTGQIAQGNGYQWDTYVNSVMAAAPQGDPKVMMYYAFESGEIMTYTGDYFKDVFREALAAQGISGTPTKKPENVTPNQNDWKEFVMPSFLNHSLDYVHNKLSTMNITPIIIGDGSSVVKQYPNPETSIISKQKIFIMSDGNIIKMPEMTDWTRKDVATFWDMSGISINISGSGRVSEQNVPPGTLINKDTDIKVILK